MNIDVDTTVTSATLLSTNDAAKFLGVSIRTFKYYVKEKKISPVQFGARGAKFYSLVQLENFKNENSPVQSTCAKRKIAQVDPCKIQNCTS